MSDKLVYFVSLGCAKNLVESEVLLARLAEDGFAIVTDPSWADVIIVNTCGFLQSARDEAREVIGGLIPYRKDGSCECFAVIGCWSQIEADIIQDEFPEVDLIVGVNGRDKTVELVKKILSGKKDKITKVSRKVGGWCREDIRLRLTGRWWSYLRISEGCSQKCSFCKIPAIRGRYRSKPLKMILEEAKMLIDDGVKELVLIGQETTSWGCDIGVRSGLVKLLRELSKLKDLDWIRVMYTYPSNFTDEIIRAIAEIDKVVKYIDIPLQHINTKILKLMRRGIDRKGTEILLEKIRKYIPDVALRTTMIVGFPGEGEKEFRELIDFIKEFEFDALGAFIFSPERGTIAEKLEKQIPEEVKIERWNELMRVQKSVVRKRLTKYVSTRFHMYIDEVNNRRRYVVGRHSKQGPEVDGVTLIPKITFAGNLPTVGDKLLVKCVGVRGYDLLVEPVNGGK